jgi:hypothetical protein
MNKHLFQNGRVLFFFDLMIDARQLFKPFAFTLVTPKDLGEL